MSIVTTRGLTSIVEARGGCCGTRTVKGNPKVQGGDHFYAVGVRKRWEIFTAQDSNAVRP